MTDLTFPQHGDLPDAAYWAFLGGTPPTSCIVSGLGLTPDYTAPDVDVAGGKALIDRGTMDTSHPNIDPAESLEDSVAVVQVDAQTVVLDDGATNQIFLRANVGSDDSPELVANTTGNAPSEASMKIGEVDTAVDTVSEQWRLVAADGTLTFPDKSAANSAAPELPNGTVVYSRDEEAHWSTIAGSLKRMAAWSDPDDDGVYELPAGAEGISVGSASVGSSPTDSTDVARKAETDALDANKADLTQPDGVLTSSQVPDLSITSTFTVVDEAARLSLNVQEGDVAIQTDNDTTYIFTGGDPSVNSNWSKIQLDVLEAIDGSDITPSSVTTPSVETEQATVGGRYETETYDIGNSTGYSIDGVIRNSTAVNSVTLEISNTSQNNGGGDQFVLDAIVTIGYRENTNNLISTQKIIYSSLASSDISINVSLTDPDTFTVTVSTSSGNTYNNIILKISTLGLYGADINVS